MIDFVMMILHFNQIMSSLQAFLANSTPARREWFMAWSGLPKEDLQWFAQAVNHMAPSPPGVVTTSPPKQMVKPGIYNLDFDCTEPDCVRATGSASPNKTYWCLTASGDSYMANYIFSRLVSVIPRPKYVVGCACNNPAHGPELHYHYFVRAAGQVRRSYFSGVPSIETIWLRPSDQGEQKKLIATLDWSSGNTNMNWGYTPCDVTARVRASAPKKEATIVNVEEDVAVMESQLGHIKEDVDNLVKERLAITSKEKTTKEEDKKADVLLKKIRNLETQGVKLETRKRALIDKAEEAADREAESLEVPQETTPQRPGAIPLGIPKLPF